MTDEGAGEKGISAGVQDGSSHVVPPAPEGAFAVLPGEHALWSRTLGGQVPPRFLVQVFVCSLLQLYNMFMTRVLVASPGGTLNPPPLSLLASYRRTIVIRTFQSWCPCLSLNKVQRLQASVAEVFRAPRNRISRAVGKLTCAKICPSLEGGAIDPVRTRAAARAAAAAAGSVPPLVPMRSCICFQDTLPAGCVHMDQGEWGAGGGIVAATVAPDTSRSGKGADIVWVVVVPMLTGKLATLAAANECQDGAAEGTSRVSTQIAGVKSPPNFHVRQVAFYGSVPGVPTQNERRLAVVLESAGNGDEASVLHLLALDDLIFSEVGLLAAFNTDGLLSPGRKVRGSGSKDVIGVARGQGVDTPLITDVTTRSRVLPEQMKEVTVALSGARGIACAVSTSKRLIVFDLEEDEDEDDEEEDEEEDGQEGNEEEEEEDG